MIKRMRVNNLFKLIKAPKSVPQEEEQISTYYSKNLNRGYLVLIGGAEDRKDDKIILRATVEINNAKRVVVIPTASNYPLSLGDDYIYAFRNIGVEYVDVLDIREACEADKSEYLEKIEKADLVFFTGGDQVKLVNTLIQSQLYKLIYKCYNERKLTIAGTSAGAAGASDPLLYNGDDQGLIKGSIKHGKGFGFIPNITVDTHFNARNRLLRLSQFLCGGLSNRGIGIDEDTAVVINPNGIFQVIGSGYVTVVNSENITFTNYDLIEPGDKLSFNDLIIGFLHPGCRFDISTWNVVSHSKAKNNPLIQYISDEMYNQ